MKLLVSVLFVGICLNPIAHAVTFDQEGSGNSGGGGGVMCSIAGKTTLVTLDYYQASLPRLNGKKAPLVSLEGTEEEVLNRLLSTYKLDANNLQIIRQNLNMIGEIESWRSAKLSEFNDHGKVYVFDTNCKYVQLAVRQNDVMYGDPEMIALLPPGQKALLRMHEAIYRQAMTPNSNGTITSSFPVRNYLSAFLEVAHYEQNASLSFRYRYARFLKEYADSVRFANSYTTNPFLGSFLGWGEYQVATGPNYFGIQKNYNLGGMGNYYSGAHFSDYEKQRYLDKLTYLKKLMRDNTVGSLDIPSTLSVTQDFIQLSKQRRPLDRNSSEYQSYKSELKKNFTLLNTGFQRFLKGGEYTVRLRKGVEDYNTIIEQFTGFISGYESKLTSFEKELVKKIQTDIDTMLKLANEL